MSLREIILRQAGFVRGVDVSYHQRGRAADVYVVATPPGRGDYFRSQFDALVAATPTFDPSDWITPEIISHVNKRGKRRSRGAVRYG